MRGLLILMVVFGLGCQGPSRDSAGSADKNDNGLNKVKVQISLDAILERAISESEKNTNTAHQKGNTNIVGLAIAKDWSQYTILEKVEYIRGVSDMLEFLSNTDSAGFSLLQEEEEKRNELFLSAEHIPHFIAGHEAVEGVNYRLSDITGGRRFGDLADAVTLYYKNNPLDREKPVLWVLAVPLFKQIGKARPLENNVTLVINNAMPKGDRK